MSRYKRFQVDKIVDYPLDSRHSKVTVEDFSRPFRGGEFKTFVDSLPRILAVTELLALARTLTHGRQAKRTLIWGLGGHVIKVGLAPVLIDLMERGFITSLATNGSGIIHDFEIALSGGTSEDVERELESGRFGMARETGQMLNQAINRGAEAGQGIGESVGRLLASIAPPFGDHSLLLQAFRLRLPVTVHVAFGTDTIHNHPLASGAAVGKGSQIDFQIFTHQVSQLGQGGVYLNIGSAVLLPEVFLKAVSLVRNSGQGLRDFSTANLDFIQHYRPSRNVIERPLAGEGRGVALTGHHEIMVPLLAALLPAPK